MNTPDFELNAAAVAAAARRLAGHAVRTPLIKAQPVDALDGRGRLLVKAECLQIGGAFKFRGAYNRLVQLSVDERLGGVVAWSSGNHAQGVAAAGALLGIQTTIVMPADAPMIKIENTRRLGAEIVFYERTTQNRELIARALVAERGATLVPSYDDPYIIAGQGTVALEMVGQAAEMGFGSLDAVFVPVGGGGLVAGCALALREVSPTTEIYGVEPEEFDDTARSFAAGERQHVRKDAKSVCDALMAPTPGDLTWPINKSLLNGVFTVSDRDVLRAMAYASRELKLVAEPGGAVALAAVLFGSYGGSGKNIGVVLSGGNVDAPLLAKAIANLP
jgi:threonine dehydratase